MSVCRRKMTDLLNRDRFIDGHHFDKHLSGAENRFVGGACGTTNHDVSLRRRATATWTSAMPGHTRSTSSLSGGTGVQRRWFCRRSILARYDVLRGGPKKGCSAVSALYLNSEKPA
jgi:hypothetical protein